MVTAGFESSFCFMICVTGINMLFFSIVLLFLPFLHASERLTEQDRFRQCGSTYRIGNVTSSFYALEGEDVVLFAARTVDEEADQIKWEVDPSHSQITLHGVKLASITKTDRLILQNVTSSFNLSKYRYRYDPPNTFTSAWVTLRVGAFPRISSNGTQEVFVLAGEMIPVICVSLTGLPAPDLIVQLRTAEGFVPISYVLVGGSCVKMNSTTVASGIITATAANCFGNSSLDFKLLVLVKPSVHLNIEDRVMIIDVHHHIIVSYRVGGVPIPQIVWYQDGIPLTETNSQYNSSQLIIQDLTVQDAGIYSIVVTSELGSDEANFSLKVNSFKENKETSGNFPWWCSFIIAVFSAIAGSAITVVVCRIRRRRSGGPETGNNSSNYHTSHEDLRYTSVDLMKVGSLTSEQGGSIKPYATTRVSTVRAACSELQDYEEPICHVPPIQERASDGGNAVSQDYEAMGLVHTYMSPLNGPEYGDASVPLNTVLQSTGKIEQTGSN